MKAAAIKEKPTTYRVTSLSKHLPFVVSWLAFQLVSIMSAFLSILSFIFFVSPVGFVQAQHNDFWAAAYPLAVRSPYLQCWQTTTNGTQPLSFQWPAFWTIATQVNTIYNAVLFMTYSMFYQDVWLGRSHKNRWYCVPMAWKCGARKCSMSQHKPDSNGNHTNSDHFSPSSRSNGLECNISVSN